MGLVTITLNNRTYRMTCDEGDEERLVALGEYFGDKISEIKQDVGDIGEDRLYVMAALNIVDELFDARGEQTGNDGKIAKKPNGSSLTKRLAQSGIENAGKDA